MRGDLVIVRAYGEEPLIRIIWAEEKEAVFITDDMNYKLLSAGQNAIQPIGFHWEDVFKFDDILAKDMKQLYDSGKWDWNKN